MKMLTMERTLRNSIRARGVGLHTGEDIHLNLRPAPVGTGIVFRRIDLNPPVDLPVRVNQVCESRLCTMLGRDGVHVGTVEHLLAACAGIGIDNLIVEVSGPEVPIMDGSAGPFVFLLESAGIVEQNRPRRYVRVLRPVKVVDGDKYAALYPSDSFRMRFSIDFDHPVLRHSKATGSFDSTTSSFVKDLSRARTFGFTHEVEYLRSHGLALGGSTENAIVVDTDRILNEDGLRYQDEFVRHKMLDAIGDLYLLGQRLIAEFRGHKSGHAMNVALLRALLANPDAWELVEEISGNYRSISAAA